ncbi:hypothetical protein EVAR_31591_1, partial [Eumeta japonica]
MSLVRWSAARGAAGSGGPRPSTFTANDNAYYLARFKDYTHPCFRLPRRRPVQFARLIAVAVLSNGVRLGAVCAPGAGAADCITPLVYMRMRLRARRGTRGDVGCGPLRARYPPRIIPRNSAADLQCTSGQALPLQPMIALPMNTRRRVVSIVLFL